MGLASGIGENTRTAPESLTAGGRVRPYGQRPTFNSKRNINYNKKDTLLKRRKYLHSTGQINC